MDHWTLESIAWDRFDASKVDAEILRNIKAAAMVERNGGDYGIYQIRNNGYGGRYHKQAHDGQPRTASGKFGKRPPKDIDLELMSLIKKRQASMEAMPRNEKNIAATNALTDKIKALKAQGAKMIKDSK